MTPDARSVAFHDLTEGQVVSGRFRIDRSQMDAFAALSGDHNPLHTSDEFARCQGFDGRVVYGALQVAQISRVIGMELPGRNALWTTLDVQFLEPLYLDEEAEIRAEVAVVSEATRSIRLKLRVSTERAVVSKGNADVSVRDDG